MTSCAGTVLDAPPLSAGLCPKAGRPLPPSADIDESFVQAAGPVLDQLAVDLDGTSVGVVLTDASGDVVDIRPPEGGDLRTPTARAEAPISHPASGRILGAVALVSIAGEGIALMLSLATRAAREVEGRLGEEAAMPEKRLLQRFLQERRRAKGPIALIDERRMFTNTAAAGFVQAGDQARLWKCAAWLLADARRTSATLVLGGVPVEVRCVPVLEGPVPVAALLRLAPVTDGRADAPAKGSIHRPYGWGSLTETEESVVELVVRGLTNRQVGGRLLISHHTVDFHLRSIFRKLDVNSRVDLTRAALER
jgi:DNA-binding CsgD family transcriptional regulator